jgi:hypothetical protein
MRPQTGAPIKDGFSAKQRMGKASVGLPQPVLRL